MSQQSIEERIQQIENDIKTIFNFVYGLHDKISGIDKDIDSLFIRIHELENFI